MKRNEKLAKEYARRIREIRKKMRLTQQELANLINCSLRRLQDWEYAKHCPRVWYRVKIDKLYEKLEGKEGGGNEN